MLGSSTTCLMRARTRVKNRAERRYIVAIYRDARRLSSGPSTSAPEPAALRENRDGARPCFLDRGPDGARIVVCVDMLGEGFDLSNLKIAALHDTSQVARGHPPVHRQHHARGRSVTRSARLRCAVRQHRRPRVRRPALPSSTAEGADWDTHHPPPPSEDRTDRELRLAGSRLGLKQLRRPPRPSSRFGIFGLPFSAQFFRTTCKTWTPLRISHPFYPKVRRAGTPSVRKRAFSSRWYAGQVRYPGATIRTSSIPSTT